MGLALIRCLEPMRSSASGAWRSTKKRAADLLSPRATCAVGSHVAETDLSRPGATGRRVVALLAWRVLESFDYLVAAVVD